MRIISRFLVTGTLAATAFAVHASPECVGAALQLDRTAVEAGEAWRLLSCHFTHWTADHFGWDFIVFALLGGACERTLRRRMVVTLLASAVTIPLAVLAFQPGLQAYRGLSGLDSALFALLAFDLLRKNLASADRRSTLAIALLIVGFLVKTLIETTTGAALFADSAAGGFVPVPLAHLVGFGTGAIASLAPRRRDRRGSRGIHPPRTPLRLSAA